jgi:hypothetical protein
MGALVPGWSELERNLGPRSWLAPSGDRLGPFRSVNSLPSLRYLVPRQACAWEDDHPLKPMAYLGETNFLRLSKWERLINRPLPTVSTTPGNIIHQFGCRPPRELFLSCSARSFR